MRNGENITQANGRNSRDRDSGLNGVLSLVIFTLFALAIGDCGCFGSSEDGSKENHQLYSDTSLSKNVWALLEARDDSTSGEPRWVGGFTGTAWLYAVSGSGFLFVTAGHNVGNSSGEVNVGSDRRRFVFLSHPDFPSIQLDGEMVTLFPEADIAFIETPLLDHPSLQPCTQDRLSVTEKSIGVVGYPRSMIEDTTIFLDVIDDVYKVGFDLGPWIHLGIVVATTLLSVDSIDVRINDVRTIVVDCHPEPGLSGSPVIKVDTQAVVGMMLGVLPSTEEIDNSTETLGFAVSVEEISDAFQRFIRK